MTVFRTPRVGRITRTGDNLTVNEGDLIFEAAENNVVRLSVIGRLYRGTTTFTIPVGEERIFTMPIPVDKEVVGVSRVEFVVDGSVKVTFEVGGTPGTVNETITGYNLNEVIGGTSPIPMQRVATLTGSTIRAQELIITPTAGGMRSSAAFIAAGLLPKFDSNTKPAFRYMNTGGSVVEIAVNWVWEVLDKV